MKKSSYFLMAAVVTCFAACVEKNTPSNSGSSNGSADESTSGSTNFVLTPEQTKTKLFDVAKELTDKFYTADQRAAIELVDYLYDKYENYDRSELENHYGHRYDAILKIPAYAHAVVQGRQAPSDLITHSYTFAFPSESVIFEADDASRSWKNKGNATDNSIIFRFKNKNGIWCEAKLWGEGNTHELSYSWDKSHWEWVEEKVYRDDVTQTGWNYYYYRYFYYDAGGYFYYNWYRRNVFDGTYEAIAEVPTKTHFTLKQNNTEYIRLDFEQEMQKNNHADFSVSAIVANLQWTADIHITSTSANVAWAFYYDSTPLISAAASLPSIELIDKQDSQTWQEWIDTYADNYDYLLNHITSANAVVDVLGKLQIKANIRDFAKAYGDYKTWDELRDNTQRSCDRLCNVINSNLTNGLYFGNDLKQAEIRTQSKVSGYNYWQWIYNPYTGYYTQQYVYKEEFKPEGVLYFPIDGTSYAFEEYFNRKPFTDLQYTVESLVNAYIRISRNLYDEVGTIEF